MELFRCKYCGKVIDKGLWSEQQARQIPTKNGFFCEDAPLDSAQWRSHKIETKLDRIIKFYDQARKKTTGR